MNQAAPEQENLATYKLIVESMKSYAVFALDKEGCIQTWNAGAEKIFYYHPDEIIGRSCNILYTPDDIAACVPEAELKAALIYGKGVNERFHVKKDRGRFWGSGLVFPLYNNRKEHIGFSKVMQKVSEEEQAQANLREERSLAQTWVSTFNEIVVILNQDMKVINATTAFRSFFILHGRSIEGANLYDLMPAAFNTAQLESFVDAALKANNFHSSIELSFVHPVSGVRTLLIKPRRIYQPPNILFSLEFIDQTEQQSIMHEKDVFISVASHEIRTPISVIKAYAQILVRELKEAKPIVQSAVLKINEQINSMNLLINALLDTSKLTTGKLILEPEIFNLSTLVQEIVEGFRLTQNTHTIVIRKDIDSLIFADKPRTGTVITNLLSNAIKYSPGANQVVVDVEHINERVRVGVQDFGLGIPEVEQGSLFQRFGRTESVRQSKIPGSGLGLHLASEIIKLQGGEMNFHTESGKGSTFYFSLPLY